MIDFRQYKTDDAICKVITGHHSHLKRKRRDFEDLWELLNKIFLPRRHDMLRRVLTKGKQYGARVFDPHPADAANTMLMGMLGHMMSRNVPWMKFGSSNRTILDDDKVKQFYHDATEQVLWSIGQSNMYGAGVWFTKDGLVTGTSISIPKENLTNGKIHHYTISPAQSYIEDDMYGQPAVYHWPHQRTAVQLLEWFGQDKLPEPVKRNALGKEGGNPFFEYDVLYAIYKNKTPNPKSFRAEDKPFKVFWILISGSGGKEYTLLEKSGLDIFPQIWRPGKETDVCYGTSQAADALTAGLHVNTLSKLTLNSINKVLNPPTLASGTFRSRGINLDPGGRNYKKASDKNETIEPILENFNYSIPDTERIRLHDSIDRKFFVHLFELLMRSDAPAKTAYEVSMAKRDISILMTTVVEGFEQEYLEPKVNVHWDHEYAAGRMPEPPDILLDPQYGNGQVDIQYIGPLQKMQMALLQSQGFVDALSLMAAIRDLWPDAVLKVNQYELIEQAGLAQGMEPKLFRSDNEVRDIIAAETARQQAAEDAEIAQKGTAAAANLSKNIEPNSGLALLGIGNSAA